MTHLSEYVTLAELETQQVIVKSYGQHTYLKEAVKSSKPEFYANATLLSQILCPKHYISCIKVNTRETLTLFLNYMF